MPVAHAPSSSRMGHLACPTGLALPLVANLLHAIRHEGVGRVGIGKHVRVPGDLAVAGY
jgi:hypothetical protein